jgi:hypothetical protein
MSYSELLHKHCETCQECQKVAAGKSPLCTPRTMLEMMAADEVAR